ncbi:MAG: adenylate/guanylate cyclase domain-containing protein [Candidatus Koribacter versatilis]|uniref:Adenylate/guanylate cyclase domain-containing protein n=1 Tax=Candidatus Korobacter versatilis TaxID=658062 RepID=A0A932AB12_9BACT|nr:adenylate/guanylate cyclase domain-containing protein [Candidatus Koribacter versatilis]
MKLLLRQVATGGASFMQKLRRVDYAIAVVVTLASLFVFYKMADGSENPIISFVRNVEQRSLDARFELRGERPHDDRIVIVGMDEKTLHNVGAWPIPRDAYAKLIDKLKQGGARVVAFDVTFPTREKNGGVEALKQLEAQTQNTASPEMAARVHALELASDKDAQLAAAMKRADNVVLGHLFLDKTRVFEMDPKAAQEYYDVAWGKSFPQINAVGIPKGGKLDTGKAFAENGGVVFDGVEPNLKLLAESAKSFGFFNATVDTDGTVRRAMLVARYQELDWFPSLALQTLREAENIQDQDVSMSISPAGLESVKLGRYNIKVPPDGSLLVNYAGPYRTYQHHSMADVLDGTVPPETFKDKIVFLGATALGIGDMRSTPFHGDTYMGVEIHANELDNMLHYDERGRGFLTRGRTQELIDLCFIVFFGMGMGYAFSYLKPLTSTITMAGTLALFTGFEQWEFSHYGVWLSFVVPAATLVANFAAITSFRMIFEEREKRKVRRTFERYVSPGVIRLIEQDPGKYFRAGGEMKDLTIMFSDIRSFTAIAEGLTPNELVELLNEYLGEMTEILFQHWGTLDKYIGDAIMGFWGSPYPQEDHAIRACGAALRMGERLDELNEKWSAEGGKTLNIGIGLNSGPVNVGNMGSDKRFAWTVMGDHVNLASRLEGKTKDYGVRVIISENTYEQVKEAFVTREIDRITVKGKTQPVSIYELMGFIVDQDRHVELINLFASALDAYRRMEWQEAMDKFEEILTVYPGDGPTTALLHRCHHFIMEPPQPGWDGVYEMKTK